MRAAAGLALLLTACSPSTSDTVRDNGKIDCAIGGAASFTRDCTVEHSTQDHAAMLIVRHPDGAFRRFKVLDDGQSLAPADGAEALAVARTADRIDVSVDSDRYRFPTSMLSHDEGR